MPHTNRKPPPPHPSTFSQMTFVNLTLSADDVANIKAANWGEGEFDLALHRLCMDGYKMTLRYDERNDCFAAWLIAPDKSANKGLILAGRGSTPHKAVKQLCFIHYKLLEGDWTEGGDRPTNAIDD